MSTVAVVAEDDEMIRSILRHKLAASGFDLRLCVDGEEARQLLDEGAVDPDVVILDVMMPRVTGIQLLRSIRRGELAVDSDVPVVLLTSRSLESDVLTGLDSGADDYITKPFSPNELLARVQRIMRN